MIGSPRDPMLSLTVPSDLAHRPAPAHAGASMRRRRSRQYRTRVETPYIRRLRRSGFASRPAGSRRARRGPTSSWRSSGSRVPISALDLVARAPQRARDAASPALRSHQAKTSTAAAAEASATAPPASGPGRSTARAQQQRAGEVGERASARRGASRSGRAPWPRRRRPARRSRRRRSPCARRRGRRRPRRRAGRTAPARARSSPRPASPRDAAQAPAQQRRRPATRRRRRRRRTASWNGSRASGSARLTSGMTAKASASRATPRTPGTPSAARSRGLRPEATFDLAGAVRTAAAQCVGPWTSRPLRSAMPPRRSLLVGLGLIRAAPARARGSSPPRSRGRATSMRSSAPCTSGQDS